MKKQTVKQFGKFWTGGFIEFWFGYAVFAICYSGFKWGWLPAKVAADLTGWIFNYLVQRFWAFKGQIHLSEMEHAGRYIFIETIGFFLDYGIIGGLNALGITPYIGFFLSAGFFTIWSWLWYKHWVFPEKKDNKIDRTAIKQ